jgi:hypothetical protein
VGKVTITLFPLAFNTLIMHIRCKGLPVTGRERVKWGGWLTPRPDRFTPAKETQGLSGQNTHRKIIKLVDWVRIFMLCLSKEIWTFELEVKARYRKVGHRKPSDGAQTSQ